MKIRMMLMMFIVLAIVPAVFAQTTIKLFDPVFLNADDTITQPTPFRTTTVNLSCPTAQTGTLSGSGIPSGINDGSLIVDDFLTVNGTNVCPNGSCFSFADDNSFFPARDLPGVFAIDSFFVGVNPIEIQLAAGINTLSLVNGGGTFGSTEINLTSTCTVITDAPVDTDGDGIPDTCDIDSHPGATDFDNDGIVDSSTCDTQIGPPTSKDQCKNGGFMNFNFPGTFKNQGDCIQFVNTGK